MKNKILALLIIGILLFVNFNCKKMAIKKAYKNDPDGYSEVESSISEWIITCPDRSRKNLYRSDLIIDNVQFDWIFFGYNNGKCYGNPIPTFTKPTVDFSINSLAFVTAAGEGEWIISKSKVLIDYSNKKILIKFLTVKVSAMENRIYLK